MGSFTPYRYIAFLCFPAQFHMVHFWQLIHFNGLPNAQDFFFKSCSTKLHGTVACLLDAWSAIKNECWEPKEHFGASVLCFLFFFGTASTVLVLNNPSATYMHILPSYLLSSYFFHYCTALFPLNLLLLVICNPGIQLSILQ